MNNNELTLDQFKNGIDYLYDSCKWFPQPQTFTINRWCEKVNVFCETLGNPNIKYYKVYKGKHYAMYMRAIDSIADTNKAAFIEIPIPTQIINALKAVKLEMWKRAKDLAEEDELKLLTPVCSESMKKEDLLEIKKTIEKYKKEAGIFPKHGFLKKEVVNSILVHEFPAEHNEKVVNMNRELQKKRNNL